MMAASDHPPDEPIEQRVAADRDEAFVVFHIGLRVNELRKIHRWLPIFLVAIPMLRELRSEPASGLLGSRTIVGPGIRHIGFVQYWESFESLRAYARAEEHSHFPAWRDYYEQGTRDDAAVGIWHETFLVDSDGFETVYNNMPPHGLAASDDTDIVPASAQRTTAAGRLGRTDGSDSPLQPAGSS